jgi:hypothetical protein
MSTRVCWLARDVLSASGDNALASMWVTKALARRRYILSCGVCVCVFARAVCLCERV